jgi:hypothetical protein
MTSPNTPAQELIERLSDEMAEHSTEDLSFYRLLKLALGKTGISLSNSIELERYREALKPFAEEAKNWLGVASETEVGLCTDPQVDLSLSKIVAGDFHRALAVIEGGTPTTDPRDAEIEGLREALVAVDKMLFLATTFTDEARLRFAVESAHGISSAALKDKD